MQYMITDGAQKMRKEASAARREQAGQKWWRRREIQDCHDVLHDFVGEPPLQLL